MFVALEAGDAVDAPVAVEAVSADDAVDALVAVDAEVQLRRTTGLRDRAKRAVLGVLEAALEVRKLGTRQLHKDAPLILRVGSFLLMYSLDLEQESATIWRAEPVQKSVV